MARYQTPKLGTVGYEIEEDYSQGAIRASIRLWDNDFRRGWILDRTTGQPVPRQRIASLFPEGSGYGYKLHVGPAAGWRYGWAQDYNSALRAIGRWAQRRLTPKAA